MDWQSANGFDAYTWDDPTTTKNVEIWRVKPMNEGFLEAQKSRIWESDTE